MGFGRAAVISKRAKIGHVVVRKIAELGQITAIVTVEIVTERSEGTRPIEIITIRSSILVSYDATLEGNSA